MLQNWTIQRAQAPNDLPMSVDEIKSNLNLPQRFLQHDGKLIDLIQAATEQFEADTGRVCITQTFELLLDYLGPDPIDLFKRPVQSIESISYLDAAGDTQTVDPGIYRLSTARRQVYLGPGQAWPSDVAPSRESIAIRFVAGTDEPAQVPRLYREAISLAVGAWFLDPADEKQRDGWRTAYQAIVSRLFQELEV